MIDPRRMIRAMNVRANDFANETGIRNSPGYVDAIRLVCRHWMIALERRSGLVMLEEDPMKLLGDQMDYALANSGIVDFNRGEKVPKSLKRYLYAVARAAFGDR